MQAEVTSVAVMSVVVTLAAVMLAVQVVHLEVARVVMRVAQVADTLAVQNLVKLVEA